MVLGVEKKSVSKLQNLRTVKKIVQLDEHVAMAFAGMLLPLMRAHRTFRRDRSRSADAKAETKNHRAHCRCKGFNQYGASRMPES